MSIDDYIDQISSTSEQCALSRLLSQELITFGVMAIVVQPLPYGGAGGKSEWNPIVSTFPESVKLAYQEFHNSSDPFLEAALAFGGPVHFHQIRQKMVMSEKQTKLFKEFGKAGLLDGVAMPVLSKPGVGAYCAVAFRKVRDTLARSELRRLHIIFSEFYLRHREISRHEKAMLSDRERQILVGIIKGKSNAQMSEEFSISLNTVDTYVRRCFEKLDVRNRTEAALKYFSLGAALDP